MNKTLNIKDTFLKVFKNTILVQVIGVLVIPLIYFHFNEKDFADYSLFFSISAISSIFFSLRMENLFFSLNNYKRIFIFSIFLILLVSFISIFLILIFFNNILYLLCVFGGASIALFNLLYNFLVRESCVYVYTKLKLIRVFLELIGILVICWLNLSIFYLITFTTLSYFLLFGIFAFGNIKENFNIDIIVLGFYDFIENIKYVGYDFIASALNSVYIYLPTIYFHIINTPIASGNYFLILKVFGVPLIMIGQSISTVVRQFATNEFQEFDTINKTFNFFKRLVKKFIILIFIILIFSPFVLLYLIDIFYISGIFSYAVLAVLLMIVRGFYNSISSVVYIFKMQLENLIFQSFLVLSSLFFLSFNFFGINPIHFYSLGSILLYTYFIFYLYITAAKLGYIEK